MFLGLPDPDPDPLVRGMALDPDPSLSHKGIEQIKVMQNKILTPINLILMTEGKF
jgi:hypothetical protein